MIFVDRNGVPPPAGLLEHHQREIQRMTALLESSASKRSQRRLEFVMSPTLLKAVRDSLKELFQGKCAFCERPGSDIERFRPRSRATRLDGRVDPEHYWWLASDWGNLYLCCRECNLRKRNLFPILGEAAHILSNGDALKAEQPLLIDPCQDNPRDHLRFLGDGEVVALTERGAATIKTFQLNDNYLVQERRHQAELVKVVWERLLSRGKPVGQKEAEMEILTRLPGHRTHQAVIRAIVDELLGAKAQEFGTPAPRVEPPKAMEAMPDAIWLKTIEIENFKTVSKMRLSFPKLHSDGDSLTEPWLMVLGENGVGKSSLLQAIALAVMPADDRDKLDAGTWLRKGKGIREGMVRLTFSDGSERLMTFKKGQRQCHIEGDAPKLPVLAYGSTRLLPGANAEAPASPGNVFVQNLFEHTHPLVNAELYLCDKDKISADRFELLATSLKGLLPVSANAELSRTDTNMESEIDGKTMSLSELSDGYKSVLALAMDIMFHLTNSSFDMDSVQGLVMIDELELHLHPRWKIQIVDRLRRLFPLVRFIASTHDPLCVHGLKKGELWVMAKHPEDKSFMIEQIDVPHGTRADEVLTGPWFGLQSTMDTDTLMLMSDHSALLQQTKPNKRRLANLEKVLRERMGAFGNTRAQRAALVAAAVLDRGLPEAQADQLIKHRLQNILDGNSGE